MNLNSFATFEEDLDAALRCIVTRTSDTAASAFNAAEMVFTIDRENGRGPSSCNARSDGWRGCDSCPNRHLGNLLACRTMFSRGI